MEKIPFVYQWENINTGKKYLGSHYGYLNDGYISSSKYFNEHYSKEPKNFKRVILKICSSRKEALDKERELLYFANSAKSEEYYNLHNESGLGWSHHEDPNLSKIYYERISKSKKGKPAPNKNVPMKDEQKDKLSDTWVVSGPNIQDSIEIKNMLQFCKENNLNPSAMSAVARGKVRQHKGFFCKKITNNRNVIYEPKEWKSKGKVGGSANFGSKNGWSKKVKIDGIIYDCMREASEKTGLSLHLIRKLGDFNV
jgi:hypothetical protein